jgi:two-component system, NarL family, sensor kinase
VQRRRIAADLHDGVVQDLTGVSLEVDRATRRLDGVAEPATVAILAHSAETTRESVRALRTLLGDVYPPELATEGLIAALPQVVAGANRRGTPATLEMNGDFRASPTAEAMLFRAAQEGLRNAAAHAAASRVVIRLGTDGEYAWLEVRDNGVGFDPDASPVDERFGLRALQDLLRDAGGDLHVRSARGRGTVLRADVPTP